ncbi:hypothetical protein L596_012700 [Steinernema carpocapsae]|uniref:Uncharacterized protein n=1 Tax=Steinernema carpocapsae TaxID=34508 RepID=A0A4U5NY18_STECR|nr:hypothetical protein L596_012700 [Steinernema carpocapsae]
MMNELLTVVKGRMCPVTTISIDTRDYSGVINNSLGGSVYTVPNGIRDLRLERSRHRKQIRDAPTASERFDADLKRNNSAVHHFNLKLDHASTGVIDSDPYGPQDFIATLQGAFFLRPRLTFDIDPYDKSCIDLTVVAKDLSA